MKIKWIGLLMIGCFLVGCSHNQDRAMYDRSEVDRMQVTLIGTIEKIEEVNVSGKSSWVGSTTGTLLGGVAGSTIGSGWGRLFSSLAGSLFGGVAGSATEKQLTKTQGLKLTIRRQSGEEFSTVVIPKEGQAFTVGETVKVISSSSGATQVIPLSNP